MTLVSQPVAERKARGTHARPLLFVVAAALLWSTGGLFIKWTSLSGLALSFWRSFFAAFTVAIFTRHEGFGLNRLTAAAAVLYKKIPPGIGIVGVVISGGNVDLDELAKY